MEYSIHFDEKKNIVYCEVIGEADQQPMIDFYLKLNEVAVKNQCKFIIADFRKRKKIFRSAKTFFLTEQLSEVGVDKFVYGAIVDDKDEDEYKFAEDLAKNRGWTGLRHFKEMIDAEAWIAEKKRSIRVSSKKTNP